MKKSLLALFMALILSLTVLLTGCGSDEEEGSGIKTGEEIQPLTITLYSITNDSTTPEQIAVVQEAFNSITQAKYNTNVILKLYPESEYQTVVDSLIQKNRELSEGNALTFESADNLAVGEYPKERENQIDIFLVNSYKTYCSLAEAQDISAIDEELSNTATLLKSYIYPFNLNAAKVNGETYGVFNNSIYGGYKYLLLNKEIVDAELYDPENLYNTTNMSSFLRDVKAKYPDVIPFLGDIEAPIVNWTGTDYSLLGSFLSDELVSTNLVDALTYTPTSHPVGSLLENEDFITWAKRYNKLYTEGCIVEKTDANSNSKFAATIIEGDVTLSPTFSDVYGNYKVDEKTGFKYTTIDGVDYYVNVYQRPLATNENVFNAGYCVSAYTENLSRCMEILTCLNTDAELSNTFMYGVKDVHYTVNEETGIVTKISDSYSMNIEYIGNIYLLKQSTDMNEYWTSMSNNNWQNAKNTNREAIMSPTLGFNFVPNQKTKDQIDLENADIAEKNDEEGTSDPYLLFTKLSYEEACDIVAEKTTADVRALLTYQPTPEKDFSAYLNELKLHYQIDSIKPAEAAEALAALTSPQGMYYLQDQYNEWYAEAYGGGTAE